MSKDAPPYDSEQAMKPLWAESPYHGNIGEIIRQQAARPETWREAWPDVPRIVGVRDLLTRMLRREYHFQSDSFLPDDAMNAILVTADFDEWHDMPEFIMMVEETFDVKIDDECAQKIAGLTYLEFIELLLPQMSPEHLLRPLVLRADYFKSGWRPSLKRWLSSDFNHGNLRDQQARRTPDWVEKWLDHESLIELRDRVGRMLAGELNWPNTIFVPGDQLGALLHHKEGPKKAQAALGAIKREFDLELPPNFAASPEITFLDLLHYIEENGQNSARTKDPG